MSVFIPKSLLKNFHTKHNDTYHNSQPNSHKKPQRKKSYLSSSSTIRALSFTTEENLMNENLPVQKRKHIFSLKETSLISAPISKPYFVYFTWFNNILR